MEPDEPQAETPALEETENEAEETKPERRTEQKSQYEQERTALAALSHKGQLGIVIRGTHYGNKSTTELKLQAAQQC